MSPAGAQPSSKEKPRPSYGKPSPLKSHGRLRAPPDPGRLRRNGTTNYTARAVTVADHLSAAQATKTLAHELAHCLLHDGTEYALGCRRRAEVEAESVAYIVCQAAGLTTAAYTFGYVAGWSGGDLKVVKASAERVVTCARQVLERPGLVKTSGASSAPLSNSLAA